MQYIGKLITKYRTRLKTKMYIDDKIRINKVFCFKYFDGKFLLIIINNNSNLYVLLLITRLNTSILK